jgi:hypothetical protein
MGLHYGFTAPTQCIKYLLGSHDQARRRGAWCTLLNFKPEPIQGMSVCLSGGGGVATRRSGL